MGPYQLEVGSTTFFNSVTQPQLAIFQRMCLCWNRGVRIKDRWASTQSPVQRLRGFLHVGTVDILSTSSSAIRIALLTQWKGHSHQTSPFSKVGGVCYCMLFPQHLHVFAAQSCGSTLQLNNPESPNKVTNVVNKNLASGIHRTQMLVSLGSYPVLSYKIYSFSLHPS